MRYMQSLIENPEPASREPWRDVPTAETQRMIRRHHRIRPFTRMVRIRVSRPRAQIIRAHRPVRRYRKCHDLVNPHACPQHRLVKTLRKSRHDPRVWAAKKIPLFRSTRKLPCPGDLERIAHSPPKLLFRPGAARTKHCRQCQGRQQRNCVTHKMNCYPNLTRILPVVKCFSFPCRPAALMPSYNYYSIAQSPLCSRDLPHDACSDGYFDC
jgi:hypothetical protein